MILIVIINTYKESLYNIIPDNLLYCLFNDSGDNSDDDDDDDDSDYSDDDDDVDGDDDDGTW